MYISIRANLLLDELLPERRLKEEFESRRKNGGVEIKEQTGPLVSQK